MYAFSDWVISLFEKNGIVLKHNRSTYVYGLDIFLYTCLLYTSPSPRDCS